MSMTHYKDEERVLVVSASLLHQHHGHFTGFCPDVHRYNHLLIAENHQFKRRGNVEEDPEWKQLIPYILVRHRVKDGRVWYLSYQRSSTNAEQRLANQHSVGFGGHISEDDIEVDYAAPSYVARNVHYEVRKMCALCHTFDYSPMLMNGMIRELFEELDVYGITNFRVVGLINLEGTPVDRVHLGIVTVVDLECTSVFSNDSNVTSLSWSSVESLKNELPDFETWSQECIMAIADGLIR